MQRSLPLQRRVSAAAKQAAVKMNGVVKMKKILIVEDDPDIREMLVFFLEDQGYVIGEAADGVEGAALFSADSWDMVLLDILLPKMDGYALAELIRRQSEVPVVIISALDSEADQIKGFDLQIDDYIPKPISLPVLQRKVEAIFRRCDWGKQPEPKRLSCGRLVLDMNNYRAFDGDRQVDLTKKEYEILKDLLENQGRVISRESFLDRLWKYEFEGDDRAVDNHIKNLRRKLGSVGNYIETVRGVGYRIDKIR